MYNYLNDLVSIIIPSYNRYELLHFAIQSVLNQTYKNIEIIVINDCSTDQRYYNGELEKYPHTTIIHLKINLRKKYNVSSAQGFVRNIGVEKSKGVWISYLDDDDMFKYNKIELQLKKLQKTNELMCCTNMFKIHHHDISINIPTYTIISQYFNDIKLPNIIKLNNILNTNLICNSTVLIHRSILDKSGLQKIIKYEDYELWLRTLKYTNCLYIDIPLVYYTVSTANEHIKNYI